MISDNELKRKVQAAMNDTAHEGGKVRLTRASGTSRPFMAVIEGEGDMFGAGALGVLHDHDVRVIGVTHHERKTYVHLKRY